MKIYLAARYSRIAELNSYKALLEESGHVVTSRWLDRSHQRHGYDAFQIARGNELDLFPEKAALFAKEDVEDIHAAHIILCFSEEPRKGNPGRGGRHIEFGLAFALGKRVVVIGPRENVFHCLPEVEHYPTWDAFLRSQALLPVGD